MMREGFCKQFIFLAEDIKSWRVKTVKGYFYLIFEGGFWAVISYRIRRALFFIKLPAIKKILRLITFLLYKISEAILGISLPTDAKIGPGLYIGHTGGIVIHCGVVAGKNLRIGQLVTIGQKGEGHDSAVPVIGDNVYIGVGAKLFGGITIGDNAKIGANAVVVKDVPAGATAVGVPAKIITKS